MTHQLKNQIGFSPSGVHLTAETRKIPSSVADVLFPSLNHEQKRN